MQDEHAPLPDICYGCVRLRTLLAAETATSSSGDVDLEQHRRDIAALGDNYANLMISQSISRVEGVPKSWS